MAYPERPWWLPVRLELAFGADPAADPGVWAWTDVSPDLDREAEIQIGRGRADEAAQPSPTSASPRLVNNRSDYTPGHPLGAYYPYVRQGVPARISVQAGGPHLSIRNAVGARARVATTAALNVSALDVAVELALDRLPAQLGVAGFSVSPWEPYQTEVIGRYNTNGARMWRVFITVTGGLQVTWSTTGADFIDVLSTDVVPYAAGQRWALRVTLDPDNGDGGHTVTFYTAPSITGPWSVLGDPIARPGTTSLNAAGGADLDIGDIFSLTFARGAGRYYGAVLRDGVDGPLVADADFTAQQPGATSWTDSVGRTWQVMGAAEITDWRTRMVGTVDEWAPTWPWGDLSDPSRPAERPGEARTDITISGILRRLGQGAKALQSTLRRAIPQGDGLLGYWPLEDGPNATSAAPVIPGTRVGAIEGLDMAANSSLPSSAPLPQVSQDGGSFRVSLPSLPNTALGWRAELVYFMDEMPDTSYGLWRVWTTGGAARITGYLGAGEARIRVHDVDGNVIAEQFWTDATALAAATAGWCRVRLVGIPISGGWDYRMWWTPVGQSQNWYVATASAVGPMPYIRPVRIDSRWTAGLAGLPVGHITYVNDPSLDVYRPGSRGPEAAYDGERALARMRRLAVEEHLPISVLGDAAESPQMGPQGQATLLELLQQCADADGGILYELRDTIGLGYRARYTLYNQAPGLVLDARRSEIDNPFAPILDDQRLRNDITVSRTGGSSARAVDEGSINEVGLYDDSVTLNVATDGVLEGIAGWRLHRGTWPGMRYPAVTTSLDLAPQTIDAWLDRLEGDRLQVVNLPPQHPTDVVDLMVEGLAETITPTRWRVEANASPGGVWAVGEIGEPEPDGDEPPTHVDTDGSELDADVDETATGLIVQTTVGLPWTTSAGPAPSAAAGDLPVDLVMAGEVVTATSVEPFAWDTFDRSITGGWGVTPSGITPTPEWVPSGGLAAERSVSGGQGIVTVGTAGPTRFQMLSPWSVPDLEMAVTVTPAALATGASLTSMLVARITGSDYYAVRLDLGTSGAVGIEAVRSGTSLSGLLPTGLTYTAGTALRMRMRVDGDRIRGRVWPVGRPEPGGWLVDWTVTSGQITTGLLAVTAARLASNTNADAQFSFSAFEISNPQFMTVDRSVNGIVKPHAAGADVRLANPMIIAL
ncbi:hypothetical protein [Streptomyces sp. MP131-18]|uniref:hypothetical protein n=1 Tax=Streptomyces sp. MP131-18 TaxID=1857892 RepID=UPI00097BF4A5|nr:hypothetical protein [Streptomyces sp. MP131-18]ONK09428.1 hypothetical protein STBA_01280 [Streptomyces sp. MP131-18]